MPTEARAKPTPGPWYAEQPAAGFSAIRQDSGAKKLIFALSAPSAVHGDEELSDDEKYANLALVAAAPELFVALKMCHSFLAGDGAIANDAFREIEAARAAIAKAEGGA